MKHQSFHGKEYELRLIYCCDRFKRINYFIFQTMTVIAHDLPRLINTISHFDLDQRAVD